MSHRRGLSNLGIQVYGLGAIALGLVGLVWGDFATTWQPVQALPFSLPHRTALAYIVAACLLLGGAAMQWRRTAQGGVVTAAIVYFIFNALLQVPRVVGHPLIYGTWGGFFEQFSLAAAGVVAYAYLARRDSPSAGRTARIGLILYGICVVSYGVVHLAYIREAAPFVPKWIPLGQTFWVVTTGVAFLLAAIAILSGIKALLASRLLTAMLFIFWVLVWVPTLFIHPHAHLSWAANAISVVFVGAAWVVADSIAGRQRQARIVPDPWAQ